MTVTLEHPEAVMLVFAVPALFLLRRYGLFRKTALPLTFSDWKGKRFEWKHPVSAAARIVSAVCCAAGFLLCAVALSEPVLTGHEKVYTSRGTEIIFVMDTSPSMAALDIGGMTRLDAAKQTVSHMVTGMSGASFALVSMASEAALIVPPTLDHASLLSMLDSLAIGELGDGTAIGTGIATAVYHAVSSAAPKKCIAVLTDGENNAGDIHPLAAAKLAADYGITVYVAGIGTKGSVLLEYTDPATGKLYSGYLDSDFDEMPLREIAEVTGGRYFGTENLAALENALADIARRENVVQSYYFKTAETPLFGVLLAAALCLFACAWIIRRLYMKELI